MKRFLRPQIRLFSYEPFSKEDLAAGRKSVMAKMKKLKEQPQEEFKHNPEEFSIVKKRSNLGAIQDGVYFYNKPLKQGYNTIYQTNMNIYGTSNYVDAFSSAMFLLSGGKLLSKLYFNTMGPSAIFWGSMFLFNTVYLTNS